jgi:hypothetical protein
LTLIDTDTDTDRLPLFQQPQTIDLSSPDPDASAPVKVSIQLDRDELLIRRDIGLYGNNIDFVYMAIEIDFPGKLLPKINVSIFAERWASEKKPLTEADVTIALGRLSKKGLLALPSLKVDVAFTLPEDPQN